MTDASITDRSLLNDVGKFMREQSTPTGTVFCVLPIGKHNVPTQGESPGIHRLHHLRGNGSSMHAHTTEVVPKSRLEEGAHPGVEDRAGAPAMEEFVHRSRGLRPAG